MHTNTPNGVIIATTLDEHRFYRILAEWRLMPQARKWLRLEVLNNPGWCIEIDATGELYLSPSATITGQAETIQDYPHLEAASITPSDQFLLQDGVMDGAIAADVKRRQLTKLLVAHSLNVSSDRPVHSEDSDFLGHWQCEAWIERLRELARELANLEKD